MSHATDKIFRGHYPVAEEMISNSSINSKAAKARLVEVLSSSGNLGKLNKREQVELTYAFIHGFLEAKKEARE